MLILVIILSMVGSFAKFKKRTNLSIDPFYSKSVLENLATSIFTPMAPNTIAKFSSLWSKTSFFFTREAYLTIQAPIWLWDRPFALNKGIFYPRMIEFFIVSMAEIFFKLNLNRELFTNKKNYPSLYHFFRIDSAIWINR